jgi:hypothetical protein
MAQEQFSLRITGLHDNKEESSMGVVTLTRIGRIDANLVS